LEALLRRPGSSRQCGRGGRDGEVDPIEDALLFGQRHTRASHGRDEPAGIDDDPALFDAAFSRIRGDPTYDDAPHVTKPDDFRFGGANGSR
jgi:hypothetical protein